MTAPARFAFARREHLVDLGWSADEPSTFICGGGGVAAPAAAAWMNGHKSSIGIGKIVVKLYSAAISVTVWR